MRLGKSTPEILAKANPPFLSLPLFVPLILADDPDNSLSANDLTLGTYFLNRCSDFHSKYSFRKEADYMMDSQIDSSITYYYPLPITDLFFILTCMLFFHEIDHMEKVLP